MLNRRQDLLLDGIEVSLFSVHATFRRLLLEVHDYSETSTDDGSRIEMLGNLMLIDAWSLVDVVHRLRICVSHAPGVKKNALVKSLLKGTVAVYESVVLFDIRYRKALEVAKTEASITDGPLSIVLEEDEDRDDDPPNQALASDGLRRR